MGEIEAKNVDNLYAGAKVLSDQHLARRILELTSDTLIVLDNQYQCVDLLLKTDNPVLNVKRKIIGENFLNILPAETSSLVKSDIDYTRKTGLVSDVNYNLPTPKKMYYFKLIIHKFNDDFILCQYRDITKRSNMKGRLRSAAIAMMEVGRVAKIVHWSYDFNKEEVSYPKYSLDEDIVFLDSQVISLDEYLQVIHEDDRLLVKDFLNNSINSSLTVEFRVVEDGKTIEYLRSTRYSKVDGQKVISGFTQNVTDFMKNRHELEMIVSVVRNSPHSIFAAKNNGEIIFINKSALKVSGLNENCDISRLNIMDLIRELYTQDKWTSFKEAVRQSGGEYHFRIKNPNPDMDIIEMDCISSIIKNWEGEDIIWFFQYDISDQIRYQEQLLKSKEAAEESERLKMAFISNMNHEIRTPLSAIIGLSTLIADTENSDLRHEYTKLISSNSDQLLRLITDVLEMSKLDAGNMRLIQKLESLNSIMRELNLSFNHVEDKAKVYVNVPNEDTFAFLDKGRLMQLLTNMINNSRKFTPPTGRIEVGYFIKGDRIELYVSDNGIGIPLDKQESVFNRFFKVNENDVGTGLGLAICKSIVDQMEGNIELESKEGEGTIFRISIPMITVLRYNGN